jgi:hypothetical protein
MTFAVTSKGFFKEKRRNVLEGKTTFEFIWTNKLREAKQFSSRGKVFSFFNENGLEGFSYNPKEEEVIREMYRVIKRHNYSFDKDNNHNINEWIVEKAIMVNNSDVSFLYGKDNTADLYSKEQAMEICIERNTIMLKELINKIDLLKEQNNKILWS